MFGKRGFVFFSVFLIFLVLANSFLVSGQNFSNDTAGDLDEAVGKVVGLDKIKKGVDEARDFDEEKWELLSKRWREAIFKNDRVVKLDAGLQKLNPVFNFFLGIDYSFSLTFVFVFVIWLLLFVSFYDLMTLYSMFNKYFNFLAAFLMTFILAQVRVLPPDNINLYEWVSLGIFKAMFYKEGVWSGISFIIFAALYLFVFALLLGFFRKAKKGREEEEEQFRSQRQRAEQDIFHNLVQKITKGLSPGYTRTTSYGFESVSNPLNWITVIVVPLISVLWIILYWLTDWINSFLFYTILSVLIIFDIGLILWFSRGGPSGRPTIGSSSSGSNRGIPVLSGSSSGKTSSGIGNWADWLGMEGHEV